MNDLNILEYTTSDADRGEYVRFIHLPGTSRDSKAHSRMVNESGEEAYVIVSHSVSPLVPPETMIFPSDEEGATVNFMDLWVNRPHVDPTWAMDKFISENGCVPLEVAGVIGE